MLQEVGVYNLYLLLKDTIKQQMFRCRSAYNKRSDPKKVISVKENLFYLDFLEMKKTFEQVTYHDTKEYGFYFSI